ncbi:MAG: translation elongation factor Ts [Patescibacteria group bacterium]
MADDIQTIKALRDETGLSFGEIKKALSDASGDVVKAREALKAFGASAAAKKADRATTEGGIGAYVHTNGKVAAMVLVRCETDFVARNPEFQTLTKELAMHVAAMKPSSQEELLDQEFIRDPSMKVRDAITQAVGKLGENIQLDSFSLLEV